MSGTLPAGYNASALGKYSDTGATNADRSIYSNDGGLSIWFVSGYWFVGKTSGIGNMSGFFCVNDSAEAPNRVVGTWQASSSSWNDMPTLACITLVEQEAQVAEARSGASQAVQLTGRTPQDSNKGMLVKYTLVDGELLNDRHVYAAEGGAVVWWVKGSWYVGDQSSKGRQSGFMTVSDSAFKPEAITTTWQVACDGGWLDAPELSCISEDAHEAMTSAARSGAAAVVYLAGESPGERNVSSLGKFTRMDGELHLDRFTYKRDDGRNILCTPPAAKLTPLCTAAAAEGAPYTFLCVRFLAVCRVGQWPVVAGRARRRG